MKNPATFAHLPIFFLTISALVMSCKGPTNEASPETGCKIQSYSLSSHSSGSGTNTNREEQATYAYNQQGNLIKTDSTWTEADANNSSNSTTQGNYTYNAEGFLTAYTSATNTKTVSAGKEKNLQRSWQVQNNYTQEKLSAFTIKSTGYYGLKLTVEGTNAYDASGALIKQTAISTYEYTPGVTKELPSYPSGWQRTWTYENGQLVDYTEKSGTNETHPYTIQNGLVTKASFPDGYATYAYDTQQRLTKSEAYYGGNLNSYYTQAWSDNKPASATLPAFKGFPIIKPPFGEVSTIQAFSYYANTGNAVTQLNESTRVGQANGKGFILTESGTNRQLSQAGGPTVVINSQATYSYTGCN